MNAVERLGIIRVTDRSEERSDDREESEGLGEPMAVAGLYIQEKQGSPEHKKVQRGGGSHPPGFRCFRICLQVPDKQLVDAEVPAEQIFAEREQSEESNDTSACLRDASRPLISLFRPQQPQRHASQDEAEGRIGLHRGQARKDAFQGREVKGPANEHEAADNCHSDACYLRKGIERGAKLCFASRFHKPARPLEGLWLLKRSCGVATSQADSAWPEAEFRCAGFETFVQSRCLVKVEESYCITPQISLVNSRTKREFQAMICINCPYDAYQ